MPLGKYSKVVQCVLKGRTLKLLRFDAYDKIMTESALLRHIITKYYQDPKNLPTGFNEKDIPKDENDIR